MYEIKGSLTLSYGFMLTTIALFLWILAYEILKGVFFFI